MALVELMQMRNVPKGTDWFVVGANEAGGQTHVTTVGEERIDEQHAIITAQSIGRQRVGDPRDVAARAPADSDRAGLHQRGEDRRAGGIPLHHGRGGARRRRRQHATATEAKETPRIETGLSHPVVTGLKSRVSAVLAADTTLATIESRTPAAGPTA